MNSSEEVLMDQIVHQEKQLVFSRFSSVDAMRIGHWMYERAVEQELNIAIRITVNRRQLFYWSADGASPDNEKWISRKENVVYHFYKSSYYMSLLMKQKQANLAVKYGVDPNEHVAAGGAFPITLSGVGVVGAITVSGLSQREDHQFVVDAIETFLKNCEGGIDFYASGRKASTYR